MSAGLDRLNLQMSSGRAMVVKTQLRGGEVSGLHIGARNVRRYFPKGTREIELELDGLQIQCGLPREFWNGRPEIHDPRLCEWLDFKVLHRIGERKQVKLAMTPAGKSVFRLRAEVLREDPFAGTEAMTAA
jgi:hypothetical protein